MNSLSTEVLTSLTTLRDYIRWGASRFAEADITYGHGTATGLDEAAALVLHTLHLPYNLNEFYLQSVLTPEERQAIVTLFNRRIIERKPAAYLTHEAIFAGLAFYIDERALVPRSPIAELIAQRFAPWIEEDQVTRIWICVPAVLVLLSPVPMPSLMPVSMPSIYQTMPWRWRKLM